MASALAGCSDAPPSPAEVRSAISGDLGHVLGEANAAFVGSRDALPGASALGTLDRMLGTRTPFAPRVQAMVAALAAQGPGASATGDQGLDVDAAIAYLDEQLFTDANHVGEGVFQVPASLVCADTTFDTSGNPVQTIDQACAEKLAKAELRVRAARDGDSLVFAIQLDADHDEPLRLALTHTSIALTLDLDDAQHAFVALASVFGAQAPSATLAGQVTGKLEILGTAKATASLAIDRALSIQLAGDGAAASAPPVFVLSSAKADVASVTLDGNARSGSFELGLGETKVEVAGFQGSGRLALDLPGLTAGAAFATGAPLALSHLGLGGRSTTISIDGARAATIDLNPQDGRALDAQLSEDAASGAVTLTVTPKLDVQLSVDHAVLGDEPPVYDVTRVLLDGSLRSGATSDQTQVVTGTFAIATSPASYGFTASAGQCVTSSAAVDPTTGAPFQQFTVTTCQ